MTKNEWAKMPEISEMPLIELDPAHLEANGIVGFNSKDARARAYNLLRTQLIKRLAGMESKLVGVTSSSPGAGKTLTATNLAGSLARLAKFPVVLVDLDFRRGSVSTYLGLKPEAGIVECLEKGLPLEAIAMRVGLPNLVVLPSIVGEESGSSLLSSQTFDDLIAAVKRYAGNGIVLFDLPPVFADDDAMIASEKLDGYLLIADTGMTPAGHVLRSIERLKPAPCLGTVLNRYEGGIFDSDGYGYGYGYDYGSYGSEAKA